MACAVAILNNNQTAAELHQSWYTGSRGIVQYLQRPNYFVRHVRGRCETTIAYLGASAGRRIALLVPRAPPSRRRSCSPPKYSGACETGTPSSSKRQGHVLLWAAVSLCDNRGDHGAGPLLKHILVVKTPFYGGSPCFGGVITVVIGGVLGQATPSRSRRPTNKSWCHGNVTVPCFSCCHCL